MIKIILLILFFSIVCSSTTYYVRLDGGTRWSPDDPTGQCNGMADVRFPGGNATNASCAFNDIRYLWSKGIYCADGNAGCGWGWLGNPGDTYIVDQNPDGWRIGYNCSDASDYSCYHLGIAGNAYGSGAPTISGEANAITRILGRNWQSCSSDSQKTQVFGDFQISCVFNFGSAHYVEFGCFDISDHGECGNLQAHVNKTCDRYGTALANFADNGFCTSRGMTNMNFSNINLHGFASAGWSGPTGDNVNVNGLKIRGNGAAGWNADPGDGTTGTGNLSVSNFSIVGSGCVEMYPIPSNYTYPFSWCTDQNNGGYGDGFGTTTAGSNPAWVIHFSSGEIAYNTQDGLDLLHLGGVDAEGGQSRVIFDNCLSYANMGQQFKMASSSTMRNSIAIGNCWAMGNPNPQFPIGYNAGLSLFCRASNNNVLLGISPGAPSLVQHNTFYSAGYVDIGVEGDSNCNASSCALVYRNNINIEFDCSPANGMLACDHGLSNLLYTDQPADYAVFSYPGTKYDHNVAVNSSKACPDAYHNETNAICKPTAGLVDEVFPIYGFPNITVITGSPAIGAGYVITDDTYLEYDYNGVKRANPPTIGALEYGSVFKGAPGFSPIVPPSSTTTTTTTTTKTTTTTTATKTTSGTSVSNSPNSATPPPFMFVLMFVVYVLSIILIE